MNYSITHSKNTSTFNGSVLGLIGINIAFYFICAFTLGIGLPWAYVMKYKWKLSHSIYNGRTLQFSATGGQLIGNYIKWILLSIITLGIYSFFVPIKIRQWKTKHTHFTDGIQLGESKFVGTTLGLLGINILCAFLIIITLTFGLPFAVAIKQKWETNHTIIDGHMIRFDGNGSSLFWKMTLWVFLTIITLSIYMLWVPLKYEQWLVSNSRVVALTDKQVNVMSAKGTYESLFNDKEKTVRFHKINLIFLLLVIPYLLLLSYSWFSSLLNYFNDPPFYAAEEFLFFTRSALTFVLIALLNILLILGFKRFAKHKLVKVMVVYYIVFTISDLISMVSKYRSISKQLLIVSPFADLITPVLLVLLIIFLVAIIIFFVLAVKDFNKFININNRRRHTYVRLITSLLLIHVLPSVFYLTSDLLLMGITRLDMVLILVLAYMSNLIPLFYIQFYLRKGIPLYFLIKDNPPLPNINPMHSNLTTTVPQDKGNETNMNNSNQTAEQVTKNQEKINILLKRGYEHLFCLNRNMVTTAIGLQALSEAINLGSTTAYSQLGNYYSDIKDFEKAARYYQKGYEKGSALCAYFMGCLYDGNTGRNQEEAVAHEWYLKAADLGQETSQFYVGLDYLHGKFVEKDLNKALHYLTLSSENGDFDAALFLGVSYLHGEELVGIDLSMAEKHLFNAVNNATNDEEKGNAYNELSILYLGCLGVNPSRRDFLNRCVFFMNEAVKLNNKDAIANLKKSHEVIIIDERTKKEALAMDVPTTLIINQDFYRGEGVSSI